MNGHNIGLDLAWKPQSYPMVLSVFGDYSSVDMSGDYTGNTLTASTEGDVSNMVIGAKISFSFGGADNETESLAAIERSGTAFIGVR